MSRSRQLVLCVWEELSFPRLCRRSAGRQTTSTRLSQDRLVAQLGGRLLQDEDNYRYGTKKAATKKSPHGRRGKLSEGLGAKISFSGECSDYRDTRWVHTMYTKPVFVNTGAVALFPAGISELRDTMSCYTCVAMCKGYMACSDKLGTRKGHWVCAVWTCRAS